MVIKFGGLVPSGRNKNISGFKFGSGALQRNKHCKRVYQGVLPSSCLRYLNKAVSLQIYKKCNWQHVNDELAIRTACEKGCWTGPRALQHVLCLTHCGRSQHNIGRF